MMICRRRVDASVAMFIGGAFEIQYINCTCMWGASIRHIHSLPEKAGSGLSLFTTSCTADVLGCDRHDGAEPVKRSLTWTDTSRHRYHVKRIRAQQVKSAEEFLDLPPAFV